MNHMTRFTSNLGECAWLTPAEVFIFLLMSLGEDYSIVDDDDPDEIFYLRPAFYA